MEKLLVSACLAGLNTKYNGKNNYTAEILKLREYFDFILICPEVDGGLPTPRDPSEIIGDKVISNKGRDVTYEYNKGALRALGTAQANNVKYALLKAKSPSCGKDYVYDGTFTSTLVNKDGITASLLKSEGIKVYTEAEIQLLIDDYKKQQN